MGESNLGTMFAGFAKAASKFGTQAAKTAKETAAQIAEISTRIHMDYEVAAEVGQCGLDGMWKLHRARPIRPGQSFVLRVPSSKRKLLLYIMHGIECYIPSLCIHGDNYCVLCTPAHTRLVQELSRLCLCGS
jgi:hypothetical protein